MDDSQGLWWEWCGGDTCPVPVGVPYKVKLGCGIRANGTDKESPHEWRWTNTGASSDIVAFWLPYGIRPLYLATPRHSMVDALLWRDVEL